MWPVASHAVEAWHQELAEEGSLRPHGTQPQGLATRISQVEPDGPSTPQAHAWHQTSRLDPEVVSLSPRALRGVQAPGHPRLRPHSGSSAVTRRALSSQLDACTRGRPVSVGFRLCELTSGWKRSAPRLDCLRSKHPPREGPREQEGGWRGEGCERKAHPLGAQTARRQGEGDAWTRGNQWHGRLSGGSDPHPE